jgi:hypothetical protein
MSKGSAERKALLNVLSSAVEADDLKKLDDLLSRTQPVTYPVMMTRFTQMDREAWYEAQRTYEFAEKRPDSQAAARLLQKAVRDLTNIAARLPRRSATLGVRAGATEKAKKGDLIQSLHFRRPLEGSIIGTVTRVDVDDMDGVEYVYFRPMLDIDHDGRAYRVNTQEMRAPQNGTPTSMGRITEGIFIIK